MLYSYALEWVDSKMKECGYEKLTDENNDVRSSFFAIKKSYKAVYNGSSYIVADIISGSAHGKSYTFIHLEELKPSITPLLFTQ